jgi:hypothetical protein
MQPTWLTVSIVDLANKAALDLNIANTLPRPPRTPTEALTRYVERRGYCELQKLLGKSILTENYILPWVQNELYLQVCEKLKEPNISALEIQNAFSWVKSAAAPIARAVLKRIANSNNPC